MPLNDYNPPLQQSSGTFTGTTGSATLPNPTTAGNTIVLVVGQTNNLVTPSGFTRATPGPFVAPLPGIYWKNTAGGESSWTIAPSASAVVCWASFEIEGLDQSNPVDVVTTTISSGTTASLSTGTTPISSTFDGFGYAVHVCLDNTDGSSPGTWSGHTGGFVEVIEQGGSEATRSLGMSVSIAVPALSLSTWSCTATKTAPVGESSSATIVLFAAAGAKRAADPVLIFGGEILTSAGLATGAVGANSIAPLNSFTGNVTVSTANPRSGTGHLRLSSSSAACNFRWTAGGALSGATVGQQVGRFSFDPNTLPGVDFVMWTLTPSASGTAVVVRYVTATGKIGVKIGTGTEVFSDAAITGSTYASLDYRVDGRTTAYTFDWQLMYADGATPVVQTQATMAGATVATAQWHIDGGWANAITVTLDLDDIVISSIGGHYPLGDYNILPITVDTGSSLTVSGPTTNWNKMTANGTMAAWDGAHALTAIAEVPAVVGASATGFAQVVNSTTAYVEIPLSTIDAAQNHGATRGVRLYACTWAASTLASTIGLRAHDGVGELNLLVDADVGADNSTTPAWICRMVRGVGRQDWTQAKLDALTARVGFSGDTSPNIGVHSIMGEVAIRIGDLITIGGPDEYGGMLQQRLDPDTSGIISFILTATVDHGYTLTWDLLGVTQTPVHIDAGDPPHEEFVGATDVATITAWSYIPDPA